MAKGATAPSSTTGGANTSTTAKKEPTAVPADTSSSPAETLSRNGRATNGVAATSTAAATTIHPSSAGSGLRSAMRPPSQ